MILVSPESKSETVGRLLLVDTLLSSNTNWEAEVFDYREPLIYFVGILKPGFCWNIAWATTQLYILRRSYYHDVNYSLDIRLGWLYLQCGYIGRQIEASALGMISDVLVLLL